MLSREVLTLTKTKGINRNPSAIMLHLKFGLHICLIWIAKLTATIIRVDDIYVRWCALTYSHSTCTHTHILVHVYTHILVDIQIYIRLNVYTNICAEVHTYTHSRRHVHTHIGRHTNIYTPKCVYKHMRWSAHIHTFS